jgi:citronellol/citronellal dehydrogenase
MESFKNKTIFITGGSRGIGKSIALRMAREGANIVIGAKTTEENPKLPGTIFTAAAEIEAAGGHALPIQMDVRFEDQVSAAILKTVATFGGIDILVNNASAISLTDTINTEMKRYDLMHQINVRGTFMTTKLALPYLKKSSNPHILVLSPPISLDPKWYESHLAYTMSKMNMSLCVLGWAAEYKNKIAVNALWPRTTIATAAVQNLLGGDKIIKMSRKPEIIAEAAYYIFCRNASTCSGRFCIDEEILNEEGKHDFSEYVLDPSSPLMPDLFL